MALPFPPPPPNLDGFLSGPAPVTKGAFGFPSGMPTLVPHYANYEPPFEEADVPEPRFEDFLYAPQYWWRYLDRLQGRHVERPLPDDLTSALAKVAKTTTNPLSTIGKKSRPRPFGDLESLLHFLREHVARTDPDSNRRNAKYAPATRRSYSFRFPTLIKEFLEAVRPFSVNPYTGKPFGNTSQMIAFSLHVFIQIEPWRTMPGHVLWRESRAATRPKGKATSFRSSTSDRITGTERIPGMSQMQVRIDEIQHREIASAIEILAPALQKRLRYRLTMAGFWITAVYWATHAIDWVARPIAITDGNATLAWPERAPPGLFVA